MSISPRFLDELRTRLTLSEVIGKRVRVVRAGREYKACCPFHKEKTPSFTINDDKQFYHCFGCGAHGDVLNFVMEHDNLPFMEAVELLAAQAGMQVPQATLADRALIRKEKNLYELMEAATQWFMGQLHDPKNHAVLSYVSGRGFKPHTLEGFRVGYAPADPQELRKHLAQEGFSDSQMIEAALVKKSPKGGDPYVFFRERIMVPVIDRRGRVVAFGGRILPDHLRPMDRSSYVPAKYMNSPETPIFHKGMMLYGENHARKAAADGGALIVTEGYFDVMACVQAGFEGAVAPMGTALTEEQIQLLWKMIPEDNKVPYLCFDGDNAGRRAAIRAAERVMPMLEPGKSVRIAFLPEGEDPDSLIQSGGDGAFRNILGSAISLIDFLWQTHTAGKRFETPEERAGLVKTLNDEVKRIQDRDVQRHYYELIKQKVSAAFFSRGRFPKSQGGWKSREQKGRRSDSPSLRRPGLKSRDIPSRVLMAAVLNYPAIFERVEEAFSRLSIENDRLNSLRQAIIFTLNEQPTLDSNDLQRQINTQGWARELNQILNQAVYVHGAFCKPGAYDAEGAVVENVNESLVSQWFALYESLGKRLLDHEIRDGWRRAFETSDEQEEEKMRYMIRNKTAD